MSIIEFMRERARYYNCPVCGRNLDSCGLRMLRHVDNNYTVQVTCPACKVAFVVILQLEEREESPVEAVGVPAGPDPISADELLDLHEFLDGFEGTFSDLLHADSGRRA